MTTERKLATVRKIEEIKPIEGADAIEAVRVDGWWVVAKKGDYKVNSLAVYLEIDSWVPNAIAPFLTKAGHKPKEFEGVQGERLRTIKLRGFTSQGLLLPVDNYNDQPVVMRQDGAMREAIIGEDMTDFLGVQKWEKPIPAQLAGLIKGNFPSFIPKTDQERIQNLKREWEETLIQEPWEVTEKLDGSSMTVYCNTVIEDGIVKEVISGVCSRNLDLKYDENNSFWSSAVKNDLIHKISSTGRNLAIQGELIGEGIQGNSYKLNGRKFFCFDIFDIDSQTYFLPEERIALCEELNIQHVPVLYWGRVFSETSVSELLEQAEGKSEVGAKPEREGLVFKSMNESNKSFKCISNRWLMKNE